MLSHLFRKKKRHSGSPTSTEFSLGSDVSGLPDDDEHLGGRTTAPAGVKPSNNHHRPTRQNGETTTAPTAARNNNHHHPRPTRQNGAPTEVHHHRPTRPNGETTTAPGHNHHHHNGEEYDLYFEEQERPTEAPYHYETTEDPYHETTTEDPYHHHETEKNGAGEPQSQSQDTLKTPRGHPATTTTTPEEEEMKTAEQREYETAMVRMWQKSKAPKKLAFPSKYPAYLKEPPRLAYEETSTSMRRKLFNQARIKMMNIEPPKRDEKKLTQMQPRINTTVKLRASFIRREPLISQYFSDHYSKFKKPPFRSNNANLKYPCYAPPTSIRPSLHRMTSTSTSTTTTTAEPRTASEQQYEERTSYGESDVHHSAHQDDVHHLKEEVAA